MSFIEHSASVVYQGGVLLDFLGQQNAFYIPTSELGSVLPELNFEKLLILKSNQNDPVDIHSEIDDKVIRHLVRQGSATRFPNGLFVFKRIDFVGDTLGDIFRGLLVSGGTEELSTSLMSDLGRALPDAKSPLQNAAAFFDALWDEALPTQEDEVFEVNDWAAVKNENRFGLVTYKRKTIDGDQVELQIAGARKSYRASALTKLVGDPMTPRTWIKQATSSARDFTNVLTWAKLSRKLSDTLYSFAATRTVFRPYQFLPAIKVLNSDSQRLLVADEVGLGKTIEAGLIWEELDQRYQFNRVLIVAPASLSIKWKQEMRHRFMRDVSIWKLRDLDLFLENFKENRDAKCSAIMSLESLRGAKTQLEEILKLSVHFDLIILDEAHAVRNRNRKGFELATVLSDVAEYLVFLSATPLNLGQDDFFNLMNLLEPDLYPDKAVFSDQIEPNRYLNEVLRLFRSDGISKAREALAVIPSLTYGENLSKRPQFAELESILAGVEVAEPELRSKVRDLTLALNTISSSFTRTRKRDVPDKQAIRDVYDIEVKWTQAERDFYEAVHQHFMEKARLSRGPVAFITQMPLRQTCSSIPVMQAKLRAKGQNALADIADESVDLPEMLEEANDEGWTVEDGIPKGIATLQMSRDSKLEALKERLSKLEEYGATQALIFTFFRGTVEYLAKELGKEHRVGFLHGGIKPDERDSIIQDFRNGVYDILVANQVGSEGLDFQFCNVLVNYDLPWNPMQVEQRIGRIDRFGQKSDKIYILNMMVPGTIETNIFLRLYNRINLFQDSVGDLEPILQELFEEVNRDIANPALTDAQLDKAIGDKAEAFATQKRQLEELDKAEPLFISGQVEVEGMAAGSPANGRYVGEGELHALVENLVLDFAGSITANSKVPGFYILTGTQELAAKVAGLKGYDSGTLIGAGIVSRLRDQVPINVTFSSKHLEGTSIADADILASRHPLVRLAISQQNEVSLLPKRFGSCAFVNPDFKGRYLANISVAHSDGVNAKTELWVTVVDAVTGARVDSIEDLFMEKLAAGELVDGSNSEPTSQKVVDRLDFEVSNRQRIEENKRTAENRALVATRKQSELQIIDRKIHRYETALNDGRGIPQINQAGLIKAKTERLKIDDRYQGKEELNLTVEPVALALIEIF